MTKEEFKKQEIEVAIGVFKETTEADGMPVICTILRSTGKIEKYITKLPDTNCRDKFHEMMHSVCQQPNVVACVMVQESWGVEGRYDKGEFPDYSVRPSMHPNRITVVSIIYYSRDEEEMFIYKEVGNRDLELEGDGCSYKFQSSFKNPFRNKLRSINYN
jgi:hypothetical protein